MILTEFGTALNVFYPKVARVEDTFVVVPAVEDVPVAYDYILEPEAEITAEDVLTYRTYNDGTVVLRVDQELTPVLTVLSVNPTDGGSINYDAGPGGTGPGPMQSLVVTTFDQNIVAVDLSTVTLLMNPGGNTVDLINNGEVTLLNDTLSVGGLLEAGTTEIVLTIPVGSLEGADGAQLPANLVYTFVANPIAIV